MWDPPVGKFLIVALVWGLHIGLDLYMVCVCYEILLFDSRAYVCCDLPRLSPVACKGKFCVEFLKIIFHNLFWYFAVGLVKEVGQDEQCYAVVAVC